MPEAKKILAVGHDAASDRAFRKLISFAANRYSTDSILLDTGKIPAPSDIGLTSKVAWADTVIVGMSTPKKNAAVEIQTMRTCVQLDTEFGCYADTHGAWTRPHFREFADKASFLCVVNDDEARRAKELFVNARIHATGNPLWDPFFKPADRDASRHASGTEPHEYLVLVPGTKNEVHNKRFFSAAVMAAGYLGNRHVVFARHPGDKSPQDAYDAIVKLAIGRSVRVSIVTTSTDALVPGADLVINGTSVRAHAIARRIPVIDYFDHVSQDWLEQDIGSRYGYFYGTGAVVDLYDSNWTQLARAMKEIALRPDMLKAAQEKLDLRTDEATSLSRMLAAMDPVFIAA